LLTITNLANRKITSIFKPLFLDGQTFFLMAVCLQFVESLYRDQLHRSYPVKSLSNLTNSIPELTVVSIAISLNNGRSEVPYL